MKRILFLLFAAVMLLIPTTAFATNVAAPTNSAVDAFPFENVQYIVDENYSPDHLKDFLSNGGIVVKIHDNPTEKSSLEEQLGIPFSMVDDMNGDRTPADLGRDIATLYYSCGNECYGIYIINVGVDDSVDESKLISEAIEEIRQRQSSIENGIELTATTLTPTTIGIVDVTTTREPKGKLKASYEVATVQNRMGKDYYFVKAYIKGMPGCILTSESDKYERKYQGEGMTASIGTTTSSVTISKCEPKRTITTGSNTIGIDVNLSGPFGSKPNEWGVTGGWSWSRDYVDTVIKASEGSTKGTWNITLYDTAQEASFAFEPGAVFECPDTKSTVLLSVEASYILDSWDTLQETITLNRTIQCTEKSATVQ